MIKVIKQHAVKLSMLFIAIILIWVSANLKWGDERWNNIVGVDGSGYYAYLPAIFIYHDLSFGFFDTLKNDSSRPFLSYNYRVRHGDVVTNKYFVGTALAQLPFFCMGHITSILAGNTLDGYSAYYLIFIQIATIFYALLGLFFLIRILRLFHVPESAISLVLIAVTFGTSIFHYVVDEPSMSHIYSFAFVNLFAFCSLNFFDKPSLNSLLWGAFSFGIVLLIRPVNGLVVLSVFFLAGSVSRLMKAGRFIAARPSSALFAFLIVILIVTIQLIIYKLQTGKFFVYSYGKEGLDFTNSEFWIFLFSYRKGFFVYTPVFLLSIWGSYYIFKQSVFRFLSWLLFLLIVVFVLSSWWQWYYGGSFGSRVMIEYYVFFAIPLGLLLTHTKFRKPISILIVMLIFICQIQTYQYRYGYLHWSEMNKERYWKNFLRFDKVLNDDAKEW